MRMNGIIRTLVAVGAFVAASAAHAFEAKPYDGAAFKAAQEAGSSILVHVTAPWCPTCTAQHAALGTLAGKPEYDKLAVFNVDFDTQKDALKAFKATSQSTLIAFKGTAETGRLAGTTKADAIEGLIKTSVK